VLIVRLSPEPEVEDDIGAQLRGSDAELNQLAFQGGHAYLVGLIANSAICHSSGVSRRADVLASSSFA
jgi:hypothetical protein